MKSHVTTIAEMLQPTVQYVIPQFQRTYAWRREDHWVPLWDDIESVAQNIASAPDRDLVPPHFMGPIVMQRRKSEAEGQDNYIIVDGQQRLTTIIIVLRAFANACGECGLEYMEGEFLSYIQNDDGQEYSPKVRHLSRRNYNDLKVVLEMHSAGTDVVSAMSRCLDFFQDRAVEFIRRDSNTEENCRNLLNVLKHKLETAVLTLDSIEQPNKVFETLNARGEPLTQSELIKNTVMYEGSVIEDEGRADVLWGAEMEHSYYSREEQEGQRLDQFFSDWLTSIVTSRVAPDRTSTHFRHYLTGVKNNGFNVDYVSRKMKRAADIYRSVQQDQFPESRPSTTRLLAARTEFFMPVVLWLWSEERELEGGQRQAILRIIESYVVRRILTGNSVGESIARTITQMLRHLQNSMNAGRNPERAAYDWISMNQNEAFRWPSDSEVQEKVANHPHGMAAGRRDMVLHALESHLRINSGQPPVRGGLYSARLIPAGEIGLANYPIEGRSTPTRLERRREVLESLGNFTLSNNRLTGKEGESVWQDKREALHMKGSNVLLNEALLSRQQNSLTEQDIVERSRWLAELCIATWPRERE